MKDFLTPSEIQTLRLAHKKEKRKQFADRIKILLALNSGYSYQEVAILYLLDDETIRRYVESYQEKGLEGLLSTDYQGGLPTLSTEQ